MMDEGQLAIHGWMPACLTADGLTSLAEAKGQIKKADAAEAHAEHVWKIASAQ